MISKIVDDGPRVALPSTIVRCVGGTVTVLRQGSITVKEDLPVSVANLKALQSNTR
jgi:tRNA A37 threonylcarbamoyladenosine synthetase subunit TsaC/SUA5/YrdC